MLGQKAVGERQLEVFDAAPQRDQRRPRVRVGRVVSFGVAASAVLAYALPGGAYDVVTRQEFGFVIWGLVALGWSLGVLPRARPSGLTLTLIGLLVAYAGWTALSLLWTSSSERTTAEVVRVIDYTGLVALVASALDRDTWRAAAIGLGFGALLVCGLAVASRLAPDAFPANAMFQADATNRLNYPFGYWNAVGAWGAMSTAMALAWSAHDSARWRRALALGLVPLATLTTYLAYSRAGVGGIVVGALAVLILSRNRLTALVHVIAAAVLSAGVIATVRSAHEIAAGTGSAGAGRVLVSIVLAMLFGSAVALLSARVGVDNKRASRAAARLAILVGLLVVVGAFAAVGTKWLDRAWREFRHPALVTTSDPASRLTQLSGTRYAVWRSALHAFSHHPLDGTGAGTYEFWWNRDGSDSESLRNAHSFELEAMAELGMPGLLLILGVMGTAAAILLTTRRRARRSITAGASTAIAAAFLAFVLQASVDWMWQVTAVAALALGGVTVIGARIGTPAGRVHWLLRVGVATAAVVAMLIQLPGLLSSAEISRSQRAESGGRADLALAWASAAVDAEPWSASAHEQRGLVLESAGRLDAAVRELRSAISNEPQNFRHWLILARIETERGNVPAAVRDYREARALRPRALVFMSGPYLLGAPGSFR